MKQSDVSADVFNEISDEATAYYEELVDFLMDQLLASGHPPFTEVLTPREQYEKLDAQRMMGDPAFWQNPDAQAAYEALRLQFAPPAPYAPAPGMGLLGVA